MDDYSWGVEKAEKVHCVICHKDECPTPVSVIQEAHMIIGDREAILDEWMGNS